MYKVHHSVADGIASILFMINMTDNPRIEDYPAILLRFTWLKDLIIKCSMPFYLIWLTIDILILRKAERNGFKSDKSI